MDLYTEWMNVSMDRMVETVYTEGVALLKDIYTALKLDEMEQELVHYLYVSYLETFSFFRET